MIEFGVLGPLTVRRNGQTQIVRTRLLRRTLAVLLARADSPVPVELLIDTVWSGRPPLTARRTLAVYISRLRQLLGDDDRIRSRPDGYAICPLPEELDAQTFERRAEQADRERDSGHTAAARVTLRSALSLWRGPAFAGLSDMDPVAATTARLEELRLAAFEEAAQLDLDAGRHYEVVVDLAPMATEFPYRERLRGQQMLALHRSGRRVEALQVYRDAYRQLTADIGIEPGADLQALHRGILSGDPALVAPTPPAGPPPVVPAQLPQDASGFAGRGDELAMLDAMVTSSTADGALMLLVTGTAGVGKTALVVRWAYRARDRFPDGQLHLDLRGYSIDAPVTVQDALTRLLRACGMVADRIPLDADAAAAAYRTLLAGRRMLIVLDNARSADQVRPLLPGGRGCVVVVTSRDLLDGLVARDGARRLHLDRLSAPEAHDVLAAVLGTERLSAEPVAAAQLAAQCAHLPLALRIAAASLAGERAGTLAGYVNRLRVDNPLTTLSIDGDASSAVRAAFDASYAALAEPHRRMFRLLSLAPGADVTVDAAAALDGSTPADARAALRRLTGTHLIEERSPGRFGAHDLLALYGHERAVVEQDMAERESAVDRVLHWYLETAQQASERLAGLTTLDVNGTAPVTPDPTAAGWFDAELANLVDAVAVAEHDARPATAWRIADALADYFRRTRPVREWLDVAGTALRAADRAGDQETQARARINFGLALFYSGRNSEAAEQFKAGRQAAIAGGWIRGQHVCLTSLGNLHLAAGDLDAAESFHRRSLASKRGSGDRQDECVTMTNLGIIAGQRGELRRGLDRHRAAVALARRAGRPAHEAAAIQYLGYTLHALGELPAAITELARAMEMHRDLGSRTGHGQALMDIAAVHADAGRLEDATRAIEDAIRLIHSMGDVQSEAYALNVRGRLQLRRGEFELSVADHTAALNAAGSVRNRYAEVEAMTGLAHAHAVSGSPEALTQARAALAVALGLGFHVLAGHARSASAIAYLCDGDPEAAAAEATAARAVFGTTGHRLGEALALAVLAQCRRGDNKAQALRYDRTSRTLSTKCGAAMPVLPWTVRADGHRLDQPVGG